MKPETSAGRRGRWLCLLAALLGATSCGGREESSSPTPGPAARDGRISTVTTLQVAAARPRFSPDGRSIVFDRANPDGFFDLYVSDVAGTITLRVTEGRAGITQRNNGNGRFHPGGRFIVFVSEVATHFLDEIPSTSDPGIGLFSNLWAFDVQTSTASQLTRIPIKQTLADSTPSIAVVNPLFSPDGNTLVWTERYDAGGHFNWGSWRLKTAAVSISGGSMSLSNERVLYTPTRGNYVTAMAYIDAGRLLVAGNLDGQHEFGMDQYVLEIGSGAIRNLTQTSDSWEEGSCRAPSGRIAFISNRDSRFRLDLNNPDYARQPLEREYYLMAADGTGTTRFTYFNDPTAPEYQNRRAQAFACDFSPDGMRMAATLGLDRRADGVADLELRVVLLTFQAPLASTIDEESSRATPPSDLTHDGPRVTSLQAAPPASAAAVGPVFVAASAGELEPWQSQVESMLRDGRLDIGRIQADTMAVGRLHERLDQYHRGLPVFGGQIVRQTDGRRVLTLFGRLYDGIDIDTTPRLQPSDAEAIALQASGQPALAGREIQLGILPHDRGGAALVYRLRVRTTADVRTYFVNAVTGRIELEYSELRSFNGGSRFASRADVPPLLQQLPGTTAAGRQARGGVFDFRGDPRRLAGFLLTGEIYPSDEASTSDAAAQVLARLHETFGAYLSTRFGRRGLDDAGMVPIGILRAIDTSRSALASAGRPTAQAVHPGDGVTLFPAGDIGASALRIDEVAHELAHVVLEYSSAPVPFGEAGALAESFADILAVGARAFAQPGVVGPHSWVLGEGQAGPQGVRSLAQPSTTMGHVFYLSVAPALPVVQFETQRIDPTTLAHMELVFYRAMVFFMGSHSGFGEARVATLQAASELFGSASPEVTAVARAWATVGVR